MDLQRKFTKQTDFTETEQIQMKKRDRKKSMWT